jgi:hypothetical protein
MRKRKKTVTTVYENWTHTFPNGVKFTEQHIDGESTGQWFQATKLHKPPKGESYSRMRFRYSPGLREAAVKHIWNEIPDVETVVIPHEDVEAFDDWDNVVCVNRSDGFTYWPHKPTPMATPMLSDYIGGYCSSEFDLQKLQAYLEKHPWVTQVELIDIPYYNADCGSAAVQFVVLPPQRSMDHWGRKMQETKNRFWTLRLKEVYTKSYTYMSDPLKLQQFRIADRYGSD